MERTIPSTESEEVELYTRTYYSLLRSTAEVQIRTLEEVHSGMKSLLHPGARNAEPDMAAFIYSLLRLPPCMSQVRLVVLGQSADVFTRAGFGNVYTWQDVSATARRRRCFFDGIDTLACFIASRSDIDDIIPLLTAYQIEGNKLHRCLQRLSDPELQTFVPERGNLGSLDTMTDTALGLSKLAEIMEVSEEDLDRLYAVWDKDFGTRLRPIVAAPIHLRVQLLSGSLSEYRRATNSWWNNIEMAMPELRERPVYFVSSNVHSLVNLLTGFALQHQETLVEYLKLPRNAGLLNEWKDIQARRVPSSRENFLYYVLKKYQQTAEGQALAQQQQSFEQANGITRIIGSKRFFEVESQVIDLALVKPETLDPRLCNGLEDQSCAELRSNLGNPELRTFVPERGNPELRSNLSFLSKSDALVLNIDYPLGLAAYNILSSVADAVGSVLGVYIMGKSATLNGVVGDVMIPNVVHDEHSQNTFLFPNCFSAADVTPYLKFGTVLDNQKAVTVQGTFLQTPRYMEVFYREGYTDIEMEAGPYMAAVYEMYRPKRHPMNEIVNLYGLPFDLGIVHYASDTPLGKGKNLGAGSLSYFGMDSTYAASLAILRRVFRMEQTRLGIG